MVLHKYTDEEQESLQDQVSRDAFKYVIKELDNCCMDIEHRVHTYNLDGGDIQSLALIKARAEGARKLCSEFTNRVASLSAKEKQ